jgi:hypothetical protein
MKRIGRRQRPRGWPGLSGVGTGMQRIRGCAGAVCVSAHAMQRILGLRRGGRACLRAMQSIGRACMTLWRAYCFELCLGHAGK